MDRAILITAFGEQYANAAIELINSIKKLYDPATRDNIIILTDQVTHDKILWKKWSTTFRITVQVMPKVERRSSILNLNLIRPDCEQILALDADTIIHEDYRDCWSLLDRFDIALTHEPARYVKEKDRYAILNPELLMVPDSFPEFNSGVIFYKNIPAVRRIFATWYTNYITFKTPKSIYAPLDQQALRYALWNSELRIATLPPEYNVTPGMKKVMKHYIPEWRIKPIIEHKCIGFKTHAENK